MGPSRQITWRTRVIATATSLVAAAGSCLVWATPAHAAPLPPCASTDLIDGLATESWDGVGYKIVLTPTVAARELGFVGTPQQITDATNEMWHVLQACVPNLYDTTADSIWAQLNCHAWAAWVPNRGDTGFRTGDTWDLESWDPVMRHDLVDYARQRCAGGGHPVPDTAGTWNVSFGVDPSEKSEDDLNALEEQGAARKQESTNQATAVVAHTNGDGLWTRSGPGGAADLLQVLPDGTHLNVLCKTPGETITDGASSDIWDRVQLTDGSVAWVSDLYLDKQHDVGSC